MNPLEQSNPARTAHTHFLWEKAFVALFVVAYCAATFFFADAWNARHVPPGGFHDLAMPWDARIPFLPIFVYPYYLYYLWVLLIVPVLDDRAKLWHAAAAFTVLQTTAVATFVALPAFLPRPVPAGGGATAWLLALVYRADLGFNLFPSLHVGHVALVTLFYYAYRPRLAPFVLAGAAVIALSTVFVKQHFLIDIPFGVLYAALAFIATAPLSAGLRAHYGLTRSPT